VYTQFRKVAAGGIIQAGGLRVGDPWSKLTWPSCSWWRSAVLRISLPLMEVGITTRYGLDGPGIESRWGWDFPHPSRPVLGPTQPPIQWVPGYIPAAVEWRWPPTPI